MESNYKTILVPVDGSNQSEDALAKGAQFAKKITVLISTCFMF